MGNAASSDDDDMWAHGSRSYLSYSHGSQSQPSPERVVSDCEREQPKREEGKDCPPPPESLPPLPDSTKPIGVVVEPQETIFPAALGWRPEDEKSKTVVLLESSGWPGELTLTHLLQEAGFSVRIFSSESPGVAVGSSTTICRGKLPLEPRRLGRKPFEDVVGFIYCGLHKAAHVGATHNGLTLRQAPAVLLSWHGLACDLDVPFYLMKPPEPPSRGRTFLYATHTALRALALHSNYVLSKEEAVRGMTIVSHSSEDVGEEELKNLVVVMGSGLAPAVVVEL